MHVVAEEPALQLVEEEDQPIGEEDLREMVAGVQPRDGETLDHEADEDHDGKADENREQQAARPLRNPPRQVGAEHVERAVREIEDAEDAENQGQSARDEEKQQAVFDAVDDLQGKERKAHFPILQPAAGSSAAFIATPSTTSFPPFTCRR